MRSLPLRRHEIEANLEPASQSASPKAQLVGNREVYVVREKLLKLKCKKKPMQLLHALIRLVFDPKELANSGGQGIKVNAKTTEDKPFLDREKCLACKGEFY